MSCTPYLPSLSLEEYIERIAVNHPSLRSILDFDRVGAPVALARLCSTTTEFDSDRTGRGDSYRRAQQNPSVRWTGIRQLLQLAIPVGSCDAPIVLDVLGGDGTLARAANDHQSCLAADLTVVTGDLSGEMVERAMEQGLPAVRQPADFLFVRSSSVDAVILAYGTHHIARSSLRRAVAEAARVVRCGGRIVLHDFEEKSPMANFFKSIVHRHSAAGHAYEHFSVQELVDLFGAEGLHASVRNIYDPIVVRSRSERGAKELACEYIGNMYGIRKFFARVGSADASWRVLEQVFDHSRLSSVVESGRMTVQVPSVRREGGRFVAEIPRTALVAVSEKQC